MTAPSLRRLARFIKHQLSTTASLDDIYSLVAAELIRTKRVGALPELIACLTELYESEDNIAYVDVVTAQPSPPTSRTTIERSLRKKFGADHIIATYRNDPALISGFTARSATRHIDMSGRHLLQQLTDRNNR